MLCPTGSTVNPSAPAFSWITWIQAQTWLGVLSSKFSFLAYLLSPLLVDVASFCAVEPIQPAYPGDSVVVAASHDPVAFEQILTYLKQSAVWYAWSQLCRCNASGTPGCINYVYSHASPMPSSNTAVNQNDAMRFTVTASGLTLWGLWLYEIGGQTKQILWADIPTTITNVTTITTVAGWAEYAFSAPLTLVSGQSYQVYVRMLTSAQTMTQEFVSPAPALPAGGVTTMSFFFGPWDTSVNNPVAVGWGMDPIICASSPIPYPPAPPPPPSTSLPDVPTATCTTIGDLCVLVNPMIDQTALLKQRLDLIQRRLLPFAWIAGTPAVGLTGSGTIAVHDVLGCIVSLTTIPATWGGTADTPRRLIPSAGSLQGTLSGSFDDGRQIHYQNEIVLFGDPWAGGIHYSLRPGIVATITPIFPEP